jgi:xanthine dehydrogenase YagR molybdenum-binding subunit
MNDATAAAAPRAFGRATPRVDGPAKVTGTARYGADHEPPHPAHAFLATSAIARGRIRAIHADTVRAMPGVLLVLTHENAANVVHEVPSVAGKGPMAFSKPPLASDEVFFAGQIVALVVAESLEIARDAALSLRVEYDPQPATGRMDDPGAAVVPAQTMISDAHVEHGDADAAWKAAPVQLNLRYGTPAQHHNPMELFQSTCEWRDGQLTVWESSQNTRAYQHGLAKQLGLPPERITVRCPYVGGAFGSRGQLAHYTALVAHAARVLGRPVKLVATRPQGFTVRTFRAETRHTVRIAADHDGKLQALDHESWELTSRVDRFAHAGSDSTCRLYACPNIRTQVHNVLADRQMPGFMRAPPELPYLFALESAMDELAHALNMDPIELRRRNDTQVDPVRGVPYTSRSLMACFDAAAAAFGWSRRHPQPRAVREGDWRVGHGCASAFYPATRGPAECRVTLLAPDRARIEIGTNEIGNGAYTILTQVAADALGLPLDQVEVVLGASDLPATPITAGSNSAASTCNAVAEACALLRARWAARNAPTYPFTVNSESRAAGIPGPDGGLDKIRQGAPALAGGVMDKQLAFAFGAQFVEVRVHAFTGEIRVPRLVGAFACGRIVNPLTARAQLMAGQVWGMSSALLEATEVDPQSARYVNHDLAEYLVPTNADVAEVTTLLVPEEDTRINPLGIKGAGEIGATGVNAAVANAVFNATGVRVRELPLRLDRLLTD